MDICIKIILRILFLIGYQLTWDVFVHRGSRETDIKIAKIKKENDILSEECYNSRKNKDECYLLCPVKDCKYNKKYNPKEGE